MNRAKRSELKRAVKLIRQAQEIIVNIGQEENDAYWNVPENLLGTDYSASLCDNADDLNDIDIAIDDVVDSIEEIISR